MPNPQVYCVSCADEIPKYTTDVCPKELTCGFQLMRLLLYSANSKQLGSKGMKNEKLFFLAQFSLQLLLNLME